MNKPLVSIILPTHNRASFLRKSVESVLLQTETNFELIIVDDASTDSTFELSNQFAKLDRRVKVIRNEVSLGGGGARNAGIRIKCRDVACTF